MSNLNSLENPLESDPIVVLIIDPQPGHFAQESPL